LLEVDAQARHALIALGLLGELYNALTQEHQENLKKRDAQTGKVSIFNY